MRFETVRIKGIGPFRDEVSVDLSAIPGVLVAVSGGNGEGKSTFLEVLGAGTIFRETPTRGSLSSLATGRDSFVEARVVNGASHTIRHTVDAVSGKSEALVLDADGAPVLAETKVTSFSAWAKAHLPSPEVFYASVFAAQGSGGFLDMKPGERKAVLSRVLGIEAFERDAERARERARATRTELEVAVARLGELSADDVASAEGAASQARQEVAVAEARLTEARAHAAAAATYRETETGLRAAEEQLAELAVRVRNNEAILADGETIRAAAARSDEIRSLLAVIDADVGASAARLTGHEARRREAAARADRAQQRSRELSSRMDLARARLRSRDGIAAAAAAIPAALQQVADIEAAHLLAQRELEAATSALLGGAEARVEVLRDHLGVIARGEADDPKQAALDALLEDDGTARDQAAAPKRAGAARQAIAVATGKLEAARRHVAGLDAQAARAGEVEAAEAEIVAHERDLVAARADEEAAGAGAAAAARDADAERAAAQDGAARAGALRQELQALSARARLLEKLQGAEVRLADYRPQLAELEAKVASRRALLAELPPPVHVDLEGVERAARAADLALATAEQRLVSARATEARRTELQAERAAAEGALADYELLAQAYGASGWPADIIDAAGPQLTALVNDLLHTCVGPRWTVSIETTRTSADGKRQLESCEVRVIDTQAGREAEARTFSGGERAMIGEAVSLALSMFACQSAGLEDVTLVRDETTAALDPANGRAWIEMLRRAAEIVGASKVFYVAHAPELVAMADARIEVRGGKVEVVS